MIIPSNKGVTQGMTEIKINGKIAEFRNSLSSVGWVLGSDSNIHPSISAKQVV